MAKVRGADAAARGEKQGVRVRSPAVAQLHGQFAAVPAHRSHLYRAQTAYITPDEWRITRSWRQLN